MKWATFLLCSTLWLGGCGSAEDAGTPAPLSAESLSEPAEAPGVPATQSQAPATSAVPDLGAQEYRVCAVCHGDEGEGQEILGAPRIGGMEAWYVLSQLERFAAGERAPDDRDVYGTQMRALAMTVNGHAALEAVATYVGSLSPPPPAQTIQGNGAAGATAYAPCAGCHGDDGTGDEALAAPALAGQQDWYLARQLTNYRNGIRGPQEVAAVHRVATDAGVRDLLSHISTLTHSP